MEVVEVPVVLPWQWKLLPFIMIVVPGGADSAQKNAHVFPLGYSVSKNFHMRYDEGNIYIKRITCKWSGEVACYNLKKKSFHVVSQKLK